MSVRTFKTVLFFAFPVALSNITAPLLGAVDTGVLGHLPSSVHVSGVGIGAQLFTFITWMFGFLRMGTTAATAPLLGKQADQKTRDVLVQGLWLSALIGSALILLSWPICKVATLFYGADKAVDTEMRRFFFICIFSAPATLANFAITGWLLGMQKAKAPLTVVVVTNIINILLDLWFVLELHMASRGVATGSLIANWCGLILNLWMVRNVQKKLEGQFRFSDAINWSSIKSIIIINRQLFIRTLCLLLVFATITSWGARQGSNVLAANTILLNLIQIAACFLDGIANAAEAKIGLVRGRSDLPALYALLNITGFCSFILIVLCSSVFALAGSHFITMLTTIEVVRSIAGNSLNWLIMFPLVAGISYWLDGVFIGLGRTDMMEKVMLVSTIFIFLPLYGLLHQQGNNSLWLLLTGTMLARSLFMVCALYFFCLPALRKQAIPKSMDIEKTRFP